MSHQPTASTALNAIPANSPYRATCQAVRREWPTSPPPQRRPDQRLRGDGERIEQQRGELLRR
jgi:hypothetical protein